MLVVLVCGLVCVYFSVVGLRVLCSFGFCGLLFCVFWYTLFSIVITDLLGGIYAWYRFVVGMYSVVVLSWLFSFVCGWFRFSCLVLSFWVLVLFCSEFA